MRGVRLHHEGNAYQVGTFESPASHFALRYGSETSDLFYGVRGREKDNSTDGSESHPYLCER